MSVDTTVPYTITAPAGVDGYGEVAVLNNEASAEHVGDLIALTFAREIRESSDEKVEDDGAFHGKFLSGRLSFAMTIEMTLGANFAESNARFEELCAASHAANADGTIEWTENGRGMDKGAGAAIATKVLFRQQQPPSAPDPTSRQTLWTAVCADPVILSSTATAPTAPTTGMMNYGKAATYPVWTFTSNASGTVQLTKSGGAGTLFIDIGGVTGIAPSTFTTVNFATRTITQGANTFRAAAVFPNSKWWRVAPGSNSLTASGCTTPQVSWKHAWMP